MKNLTSNPINKSERKIGRKGALIAGNMLALFISIEDVSDIIKLKNHYKIRVYQLMK